MDLCQIEIKNYLSWSTNVNRSFKNKSDFLSRLKKTMNKFVQKKTENDLGWIRVFVKIKILIFPFSLSQSNQQTLDYTQTPS